MPRKKFVFVSAMALYPPLLRVAEMVVRKHGLEGHVIAPEEYRLRAVYHPLGRLSQDDFLPASTSLAVHFLPSRQNDVQRCGFQPNLLRKLLQGLSPDYLWIHEEFSQKIAQQCLAHFRLKRPPTLVAYAAINHVRQPTPLISGKFPFLSRTRLKQLLLWPRLDGVCACATKTQECARRMGLPAKVPIVVNYLPVFGPEDAAHQGLNLPWLKTTSVVVGFAGQLTFQKGWRVLLEALQRLPEKFKVVIAGDGEDRDELMAWLGKPGLGERVFFAGVLPQPQLLASYPLFDVFVLPALTTPHAVEQFGAVLAEAMACGVPVIGSDSGAIPETIGDGGLIVPEGDPQALAQAMQKVTEDKDLRCELVKKGLERFRQHYSCETYADSLGKLFALSGSSI